MKIDYILNKSIKILLISTLLIIGIIISFFIFPPSYASVYEIPYFSSVPEIEELSEYGLPCVKKSGNYRTDYIYAGTNVTNGRAAYISSTNSIIFMTQSSSNRIYYNTFNNSVYQSAMISESNGVYYLNYNIGTAINEVLIDTYSTIAEATADYNNIHTTEPSLYEGINIPVGYLARVRVSSGSTFTMLTTMGTDNIAWQDKWVYTSQWYKFNDSADPTVIMQSSGITIPWIRYGNTNILGQTNKAQYTISSSVGSYVWIYNPAYMVGQNADLYDTKLNSNIQLINVQNVDEIRIFALKSTYGYNGIVSATTTSSGITYDTNSGEWIDDNGNTVTPTEFGDTNVPTTGTTLIQQFETLLSNLINRIERLLVAPVDYINQLIQSANQFFLWLRGLWSWLPGPVVESITAVLIIMCTVGALKLLWR